MWPAWVIGALAGVAKSELVDRPAHQRKVKSRAIEARFAPLEGKASPSFADLEEPSTLGSAIDYGLIGAQFGKQFGAKDAMKAGAEGAVDGAVEGFNPSGESVNWGDTGAAISRVDPNNPVSANFGPAQSLGTPQGLDYSLLKNKPKSQMLSNIIGGLGKNKQQQQPSQRAEFMFPGGRQIW
ncbi:MAG: hypothetical protein DRN81_05970 [Thermoproteota archaeon]|nr:MAG: hypothetical protein DRN81_05970 [Candidatus Korarchaeota archaeon]